MPPVESETGLAGVDGDSGTEMPVKYDEIGTDPVGTLFGTVTVPGSEMYEGTDETGIGMTDTVELTMTVMPVVLG